MDKHKIDAIIATAKQLENEGLLAKKDIIALKSADKVLFARGLRGLGADGISEVSLDDKTEEMALIKAVFEAKPDANAVIINSAPYCLAVSESAKKIPAVLDDMAQIIGPSAKVSKSASTADIIKTLKGRSACLIKNRGVVASGRTLDEAFVGSLVLEKGAKTYIESTVLGGAKPINIFEASLMHFIYKKKYSKKDQDAKLAESK